jgi:hypothetical protein
MKQSNRIKFHTWLQKGIAEGWCSNGFCWTHGSPIEGGVDMDLYQDAYDDGCFTVIAAFEPED